MRPVFACALPMFVAAFCLASKAASADELSHRLLSLAFFSSSADMHLDAPGTAAVAAGREFEDGRVLTARDILKQFEVQPQTREPGALFRNASLIVSIVDEAGSVAVSEELSACRELDIYVTPDQTFAEKASCDGRVYAYLAGKEGILISADGKPFRHYRLQAGMYSINGIPFRIY